jgi:hypothetical protein
MASLEATAKPYILPIVRGQNVTLDKDAQLVLAAWATKTAYTASFVFPDRSRILVPRHHYDALRDARRPHDEVIVWMGHYVGSSWAANCIQHPLRLGTAPPPLLTPLPDFGQPSPGRGVPREYVSAYASTMSIGAAVFQVTGSGADIRPGVLRDAGSVEDALRVTWPNETSFVWPAMPGLDEEGVEKVANCMLSPDQ